MINIPKNERKEFLTLETEDKNLYLEGMKLKGVKEFEILKNSASPKGKAELRITLIVEFPDNKQEQNLLRVERELE